MTAAMAFMLTGTSALLAGGPLRSELTRAMPQLYDAGRWRCAADGDGTAGRGFGGSRPSKGSKKQRQPSSSASAAPVSTKVTDDASSRMAAEERGRKMMEQMRLEAGAQPKDPFKKKGPALTPEELEPVDPSVGVMPEVVSQRMLRRVVPFAALPVLATFATFAGFYYANTQLELDLPPQIVAYATQALLLLSFAGITYGVMSTSWDENEEGTLLGWENVGPNIAAMRGQEMARVAEAKLEGEEADAEAAGIQMGRRAAQRRGDERK